MSETKTVGSELLNEIERVSAKRERWKGYMADAGHSGRGMQITIDFMTRDIERAKLAITGDDATQAICSLEDLRGYDSDD